MPVDLNSGSIPAIYRELFDMINAYGLDRLTLNVFSSLFESNRLTKTQLNQIWYAVTTNTSISSRNDFYKCLALMALVQQGKPIDIKLLDNYVNRELPSPSLDPKTELEDRLVRSLRLDQQKSTLCYRYNELCALDTIQVDLAPEKKGVIIRHHEYEVSSLRHKNKVFRRYNDFLALDELLNAKYLHRILPPLPPKKAVNVDKEFIEERRRGLKRYLQILSRHPILCETDILKFFLTFQGTSCGDNMKATYKNLLDEFSNEPRSSLTSMDKEQNNDSDALPLFRTSQTHLAFLQQQFQQIRISLKAIHERRTKNAADFALVEQNLQTLSSDSSTIDRWATGPNDYWPAIQVGLGTLPMEFHAVSERITEQCQRDDEVVNEHLDLLIDLLQGYQDLCKRFEEALQSEQKAIQKVNNHQRRSLPNSDASASKNEINLDVIEKRNRYGLKCVQNETQLIYANLEAFVYILSTLGNSQHQGTSNLLNVWKSFSSKVFQFGENYIKKNSTTRTNRY